MNSKNPMKGKKDKKYYREYFNLGIVLRGEVHNLEEIKNYIIDTFVDKGLVRLIKPTYENEKLCIVDESTYKEYKKFKRKEKIINEHFYFAFILRGEVKYLEKIRDYIDQCPVELITFNYEKDRLYIVKEPPWELDKSC